ncbi:proteasome assembly chaperone family protein [Halobaculum sp. WSA2]|uniref:Proteasome assembly chaperone family protein n=1 Tax=Halobaculum saliterrae TaxID=2073113 RepID=A0A6B0SPU5_9EURY|nr:PAC2 family protein [Halobaculum saliterrae]MXR40938.1 proteasome assembly chaperone family protein [Halobaculum saliterrae]
MGHIDVVSEREFDDPVLVEGLPGVGLVGKIVADHLVGTLDMELYATVHCDGLPAAAAYAADERGVTTPVRLYADADADLLVLQSDVPVSPDAAEEFAGCIEGWFREESVTPLYIAGLRADRDDDDAEASPTLRGVAVGGADGILDGLDVPEPESAGLVTGPTGALLAHALETDLPAVGLVVDSDPQFPDPVAARVVLESVVEPLTGVDVDAETLKTHADRIRRAKQQLAAQMQGGEENISQAQQLRMYQ